ncbi:MAG TPA: RnfABCDGE type electron transport complex subunit D [Prolixibacteraceae bacterium]|nr:RnfABCDGE type electron transport complex subunit D [Prolixibacteraceae bacterium]HOR99320.1 RnfABCDGE type electron transport complex subunit D [Prolixibacteraceae bacterium]HPL44462.1 RnfABCDGE type electron transport complex subunit D [Prolixibacteraceae bacterium]
MNKLLTISPSPHQHTDDSVRKIMYRVLLALVPALIWSVIYFGMDAVRVTLLAVLSCVAFEYLIQRFVMKVQTTVTDGSAALTGLLLAFNVPSNLPWWIILMGSFFAIAIAKLSFGGLGGNIFNPALVGRVFLLISFPAHMTTWPVSRMAETDAVTAATPLGILKGGVLSGRPLQELSGNLPGIDNLLLGNMGGSLGEISAALLILGGIYLLWKKIITWQIPVSILLTMAVYAGIFWLINPEKYIDPLFHILAGGAILGAIYMATDMVTSPMTGKAQLIYGIGIGIITMTIRLFGAYPEGVSFAILIMNGFTPLLNSMIKPKRFGGKQP